jgi:hypothetical protein
MGADTTGSGSSGDGRDAGGEEMTGADSGDTVGQGAVEVVVT